MNEFENFFNFSIDLMTIADVNGRIIHANIAYTAITGWSLDELRERPYWDLIHPEDHEKVQAAIKNLLTGYPVFALDYRLLCKDGSYKNFLASINKNEKNGHLYAISRVQAGQVVPYIVVADIAPMAVIIVNTEGMIIHANSLAESMFGYAAGQLQARFIEDLIPTRFREKHQSDRTAYQSNPTTRPMNSYDSLRGLKKNGQEFRVDVALNPLHEQSELYIACSIFDITEKMNTAELALNLEAENRRLARLAQRDPLTQAYNRRAMNDIFPQVIEESGKLNKSISIILMDIDHFKTFNDTYGHQTGDLVLKQIARISQRKIRENDILVRYGGEEFIVIMPNCGKHQAIEAAERIRASLEKDETLEHKVTASFGISTYTFTNSELSANEILINLIEESDQALYTAKSKGRNRTQHFLAA